MVDVGGGNLGDEKFDRDTVKCSGKVKGGNSCSGRRLLWLKPLAIGVEI